MTKSLPLILALVLVAVAILYLADQLPKYSVAALSGPTFARLNLQTGDISVLSPSPAPPAAQQKSLKPIGFKV